MRLLSGPPGLTLSLREQKVMATRQNCPNPVPGAIVIVTAAPGAQSGILTYKVQYTLTNGATVESDHTRNVTVVP